MHHGRRIQTWQWLKWCQKETLKGGCNGRCARCGTGQPDLKCVSAGFAGTDANDLLQRHDKDLAVADFAGIGRLADRFDHLLQHVVINGHFDFDLGQKVDYIFSASVQLGMALLTAKALDLGDSYTLNADIGQGFTNVIQFERLDDRSDEFHHSSPHDLWKSHGAPTHIRWRNPLRQYTHNQKAAHISAA